jgi:hypothetical protein
MNATCNEESEFVFVAWPGSGTGAIVDEQSVLAALDAVNAGF